MKILTWNLERPTSKTPQILDVLAQYDADILVLTETDQKVNLGPMYQLVGTKPLVEGYDGIPYRKSENRVSIWSKFEIVEKLVTYDAHTSVCCSIKTRMGSLIVYGTIIGVFGGTNPRFKAELDSQLQELGKLSEGKSICFIGDYNITFSGRAYPSHEARRKVNAFFERYSFINTTAQLADGVDHIAIGRDFIEGCSLSLNTWNHDKSLSDHVGVCLTILK